MRLRLAGMLAAGVAGTVLLWPGATPLAAGFSVTEIAVSAASAKSRRHGRSLSRKTPAKVTPRKARRAKKARGGGGARGSQSRPLVQPPSEVKSNRPQP